MEVQTQPFVNEFKRALAIKDARIKELEGELLRVRSTLAKLIIKEISNDVLGETSNGEVLDE